MLRLMLLDLGRLQFYSNTIYFSYIASDFPSLIICSKNLSLIIKFMNLKQLVSKKIVNLIFGRFFRIKNKPLFIYALNLFI
jgi:hypothetical protein